MTRSILRTRAASRLVAAAAATALVVTGFGVAASASADEAADADVAVTDVTPADDAEPAPEETPEAEEPAAEDVVADETPAEETTSEEPVEPVTEEPVTEEPVTEEPVTGEATPEETVPEETVTDEAPVAPEVPGTDAAEEPAADDAETGGVTPGDFTVTLERATPSSATVKAYVDVEDVDYTQVWFDWLVIEDDAHVTAGEIESWILSHGLPYGEVHGQVTSGDLFEDGLRHHSRGQGTGRLAQQIDLLSNHFVSYRGEQVWVVVTVPTETGQEWAVVQQPVVNFPTALTVDEATETFTATGRGAEWFDFIVTRTDVTAADIEAAIADLGGAPVGEPVITGDLHTKGLLRWERLEGELEGRHEASITVDQLTDGKPLVGDYAVWAVATDSISADIHYWDLSNSVTHTFEPGLDTPDNVVDGVMEGDFTVEIVPGAPTSDFPNNPTPSQFMAELGDLDGTVDPTQVWYDWLIVDDAAGVSRDDIRAAITQMSLPAGEIDVTEIEGLIGHFRGQGNGYGAAWVDLLDEHIGYRGENLWVVATIPAAGGSQLYSVSAAGLEILPTTVALTSERDAVIASGLGAQWFDFLVTGPNTTVADIERVIAELGGAPVGEPEITEKLVNEGLLFWERVESTDRATATIELKDLISQFPLVGNFKIWAVATDPDPWGDSWDVSEGLLVSFEADLDGPTVEATPVVVPPTIEGENGEDSGTEMTVIAGERFEFVVTVTGNPLPTVRVAEGTTLPSGLTLQQAPSARSIGIWPLGTWIVSGIPTEVGEHTVTLVASNGIEETTFTFAVNVLAAETPDGGDNNGGDNNGGDNGQGGNDGSNPSNPSNPNPSNPNPGNPNTGSGDNSGPVASTGGELVRTGGPLGVLAVALALVAAGVLWLARREADTPRHASQR